MSKRLDAALEFLNRVLDEFGIGEDDDPSDAPDSLATEEPA